jgi:diphosphomevalonate decarboxylase
MSLNSQTIFVTAPSNIAIVKYWGKWGRQYPKNPSISFCLKNSVTQMSIEFTANSTSEMKLDFSFDSNKEEKFEKKIYKFFENISDLVPDIRSYSYKINSKNTFPHSAGIASSASSFAALSYGLSKIFNLNIQKTGALARIGSGSATRSIEGPWNIWGANPYITSSNEFGQKIVDVHPDFLTICDAILIIDKKPKTISSSEGHSMMDFHPFAESKYQLSMDHTKELLPILKNGDFLGFKKICEYEAMLLHAMMMSGNNPFILLKPKSIEIISILKDSKLPLTFTIDAGPNIHCLYLKKDKIVVEEFLKTLDVEIIWDEIGLGASFV